MNIRIKLFEKPIYWQCAFGGACLGIIGSVGFLITALATNFSAIGMEDWIGLGAGLFLISLFLPMSLALYVGFSLLSLLKELEAKQDSCAGPAKLKGQIQQEQLLL